MADKESLRGNDSEGFDKEIDKATRKIEKLDRATVKANKSLQDYSKTFSKLNKEYKEFISLRDEKGVNTKGSNSNRNRNNNRNNKNNKYNQLFSTASKFSRDIKKADISSTAMSASKAYTTLGAKMTLATGAIGMTVASLSALSKITMEASKNTASYSRSLAQMGVKLNGLEQSSLTTANNLNKLSNKWENTLQSLGEALEPVLNTIVDFASSLLGDAATSESKKKVYGTEAGISTSARQSGFSLNSANQLAVNTYERAVELGKKYGEQASDVAQKLADAWLNGSDAAKEYGVVVNDNVLTGYMATKGVDIANVEITDAMKQYYRYQLMLEETSASNSKNMQNMIKEWTKLGFMIDKTKNKLFSFDEVIQLTAADSNIPEIAGGKDIDDSLPEDKPKKPEIKPVNFNIAGDVSMDISGNTDADVDADVNVDADVDANIKGDVDANVKGDVNIKGDANVEGDANVKGDANVEGDVNVKGDANVNVKGNTTISLNKAEVKISGNPDVDGDANVKGNVNINKDSTINVKGNSTINTKESVIKTTEIDVKVNNGEFNVDLGNINVKNANVEIENADKGKTKSKPENVNKDKSKPENVNKDKSEVNENTESSSSKNNILSNLANSVNNNTSNINSLSDLILESGDLINSFKDENGNYDLSGANILEKVAEFALSFFTFKPMSSFAGAKMGYNRAQEMGLGPLSSIGLSGLGGAANLGVATTAEGLGDVFNLDSVITDIAGVENENINKLSDRFDKMVSIIATEGFENAKYNGKGLAEGGVTGKGGAYDLGYDMTMALNENYKAFGGGTHKEAESVAYSAGEKIGELIVKIGEIPGKISDTADKILASVVNFFSTGISNISGFISNGVSKIVSFVSNGVSSIASFISNGVSNISSFISNGISSFTSFISNGISSVASLISSGVSSFTSFVSNGISNIASFISNGVSSVASFVSNGVSNIASFISNGASSVASFIGNGVSKVTSFVGNGVSSVASFISNGVSNFTSFISSGVSSVGNLVSSGVSNFTSFVSSGVSNISSLVSSGVSQFSSFISNGISTISSTVTSIVESVKEFISNAFGSIGNFFGNVGSTIGGAISNTVGNIGNAISNTASRVQLGDMHFASGGIGTHEVNNATLFENNKKEAVIPLETSEGIEYLSNALQQAGINNTSGGDTYEINLTLSGLNVSDNDAQWEKVGKKIAEVIDVQRQRRGELNYGSSF